MNLYDQLFPEDSYEGEEKVASRSMDYFGLRFDERVEKLAGIKDMASRAWEGIKSYHGKGWQELKGKGRLAYEKGDKGLKTKAFWRGTQPTVQAASAGEKAKSVGKGLLRYAPHAVAVGGGGYYTTKGHKKKAGVGDYMKRMWSGAELAHQGAKTGRSILGETLKNPETRAEGLGILARAAAPGAAMGAGGLAGGYALGRSGKKKKKK